MKEYFIEYEKCLAQVKTKKNVIIRAWSGTSAWIKLINEEKNFNVLNLIKISRL